MYFVLVCFAVDFVVSTSASDCLERLVPVMCRVRRNTLLIHSLLHLLDVQMTRGIWSFYLDSSRWRYLCNNGYVCSVNQISVVLTTTIVHALVINSCLQKVGMPWSYIVSIDFWSSAVLLISVYVSSCVHSFRSSSHIRLGLPWYNLPSIFPSSIWSTLSPLDPRRTCTLLGEKYCYLCSDCKFFVN